MVFLAICNNFIHFLSFLAGTSRQLPQQKWIYNGTTIPAPHCSSQSRPVFWWRRNLLSRRQNLPTSTTSAPPALPLWGKTVQNFFGNPPTKGNYELNQWKAVCGVGREQPDYDVTPIKPLIYSATSFPLLFNWKWQTMQHAHLLYFILFLI